MKRSNRPVPACCPRWAVVAPTGFPVRGAPKGSATPARVRRVGGRSILDTDRPRIGDRLAVLGVISQQAELARYAQLDDSLSLLLCSPQDAASAAVTGTWVTLRQRVHDRGVLPSRAVETRNR